MYQITDSILKSRVYSALTEPTREFQQRISFGEGIGERFIKQISFEKGITKLEISQEGNGDVDGIVFGSCCASSCVAEFYNPDKSYSYNGKTLFVECGIKISNNDYFYIPCGYYKAEKPETDDDWRTVKITAYDAVDNMNNKWNTRIELPSNAYELLDDIAQRHNVELDVESDMRNELQSRVITEEEALILTAYTEREVCGFLCGLVAANARINTVGKFSVSRYQYVSAEDFIIMPNVQWQNGFKKTAEEEFFIESVTSGVDDNVFTAGTGRGISFVNPIITESETYNLYDIYVGSSFQPSSCEWRGNPCVECGDTVYVKDKNGNIYTVFVASQEIDLTGGLSMTTHCPGGDAEISFDTVDERTRKALNKQYTALQQAIVDATNKINGALGGYYEVLDSDNDGNPDGWLIKEFEDGAGGLIRANKAGIGLSEDGGKTYRTAITYKGINADEITSGKVKAEFIETEKLVVGMGNVTGLDTELADLLKAAEDAESKANTAQNTANDASSTASTALSTANTAKSTANTASTNASNALSVANSANGKIANWASANNTTLIDGAKIYTGSITAKQIASESITADKLSVGVGELVNQFYNGDFSESSNGVPGWDGYNTAITRESGYVKAAYTLSNLLSVEDSEFYSTKNWVATNCSITKPYKDVDYIKVTPNNTSDWAIIATKAYLEKGKRYSVSAQINPQGWNSTNSSYANSCIGVHCNGTFYQTQYTSYSNFSPATGEINVEWVFDYTGESGNVDVGLFFRGMLTSSSGVVSINIAWVAVASASGRNTRFYSSKKNWLKSSYQTSNLINSGNYINTAEKYIAYISNNFTITYGSQLQIFFQKKRMENGKRYVIVARIKVHNLSTVNSDGLLGVWGQNSLGLSHSPIGMYINGKNESGYITVKFVFDYEGNTGTNDVGLCWKGLLDDISNPCALRFSWIQLYQDDTASLGFYCSDESWLADDYKETNLITDSSEISTYNKKPALAVVNDNLYFFGKVQSAIGNIGFLKYTTEEIVAETSLQVYEDASVADLNQQYAFNTWFKIQKPNEILDSKDIDSYKSQNGGHLFSLYEFASTKNIHYVSTGDTWHKSIVSATGLNARSDSGSVVYGSNGITIDGSTILKREDLVALKALVE